MSLLGIGLREDQRDLGVVGERDEHLRAIDHPAVVGLPRAGALVRRIRARVGLGQPEAAEPLARAQLREVVLLLLLGAPTQDRGAHERGLDGDHGPHRRVSAADLLDDEPVGQVVEAGAAVLARDDRAQVSLVGDLAHQFEVEMLVAIVLARALDDLVVGEGPRRLPDQLLLVVQFEVHMIGRYPKGGQYAGARWCTTPSTRAAVTFTSPTRWWVTGDWTLCTSRAGSRRSSTTGRSRSSHATSSGWRRSRG